MHPTKKQAHVAGFLYLLLALLGAFSLMYVPGKLIVPGNAVATASNILASETLYRISIVSGLVSGVLFIFLVMALYNLLHVVKKAYASLMAALVLISVAMGFALSVNDITALMVLRGYDFLAVFNQPQREALAMLFLRISNAGNLVSEIFWGLWLFPFGLLVIKSGFLPRILGVWLVINGFAYLVISFTGLLLPQYKDTVFNIAFPVLLGEVAIMLWLLAKGVNLERWKEKAGATGDWRS